MSAEPVANLWSDGGQDVVASHAGSSIDAASAPAVEADAAGDVQPTDRDAAPHVVELIGLAKTYSGASPVDALKPCDLVIGRGEYVAIMGPSGSGKSTLLNLLGLLDAPTEGEYRLDGVPTASLSEKQRSGVRANRIGFVFQSFHLIGYRTAVENVAVGLLYQRVKRRARNAMARDVLQQVGLATRADAFPPQLSGGERQRVAIARALVRRPALLLCDEPTGNLDTATSAQVLDLLDDLHRDGLTVLIITHDPTVAERAQRLVTIRDGHLTEQPIGPETDDDQLEFEFTGAPVGTSAGAAGIGPPLDGTG